MRLRIYTPNSRRRRHYTAVTEKCLNLQYYYLVSTFTDRSITRRLHQCHIVWVHIQYYKYVKCARNHNNMIYTSYTYISVPI